MKVSELVNRIKRFAELVNGVVDDLNVVGDVGDSKLVGAMVRFGEFKATIYCKDNDYCCTVDVRDSDDRPVLECDKYEKCFVEKGNRGRLEWVVKALNEAGIPAYAHSKWGLVELDELNECEKVEWCFERCVKACVERGEPEDWCRVYECQHCGNPEWYCSSDDPEWDEYDEEEDDWWESDEWWETEEDEW